MNNIITGSYLAKDLEGNIKEIIFSIEKPEPKEDKKSYDINYEINFDEKKTKRTTSGVSQLHALNLALYLMKIDFERLINTYNLSLEAKLSDIFFEFK